MISRLLWLLSLIALTSVNAYADYEPTFLPELIKKSDLIVEVEILAVQGKYILFKPVFILKGSCNQSTIKVEKFVDWTCASRFAQYQPHQREYLFLKQRKATGHYYPMGAGNEGEMPISGSFVYYKGQYSKLDSSVTAFKLYGGVVRGYKYNKASFAQAVRNFLNDQSTVVTNGVKPVETTLATPMNEVDRRIIAELHIYDRL